MKNYTEKCGECAHWRYISATSKGGRCCHCLLDTRKRNGASADKKDCSTFRPKGKKEGFRNA